MKGIADNVYDFAHSSHCLEHMVDPHVALTNWIRIVKPGGHLIVTVPEEYLYERGKWPSRFNGDHKWSFSISKTRHEMPKAICLLEMLQKYQNVEVIKLELIDDFFDPKQVAADQTRYITTECSIEMILRKI